MCCPSGKESMSWGPQIRAIGCTSNVDPTPKAGCIGDIGGIMSLGNIDTFRGGLSKLVLPNVHLLLSPSGSAIDGVIEGRAVRMLPSRFGPCAALSNPSWCGTCG